MGEFVDGPVDVSCDEARYDPGRLGRLTSCYARLCESGRVQGASFLLARHGKVFACRAMGRLRHDDAERPLLPDSIKPIESITKVMTATAVMRLVEDGVIWLNQPVGKILEEFARPTLAGITVWHLLTHTSGLPADGGYYLEPYPLDRSEAMRGEDWLTKGALAGPLQGKPGERWIYSSIGYCVLAEIIGRVSGRHFHDYVEAEVFRPLGMTRSFFEVPDRLLDETVVAADEDRAAHARARGRRGKPRGGSGAYSTLHDLFRFGQAFLNEGEFSGARLLGKKAAREMTRNQLSSVPAYHWGAECRDYRQGLGWGFFCDGSTVGPETYNHEGWGWCSLFVDPVERFVFASFVVDPTEWEPDVMVKPRTIAFSGLL